MCGEEGGFELMALEGLVFEDFVGLHLGPSKSSQILVQNGS